MKIPIVVIRWKDAMARTGWDSREAHSEGMPSGCISVGFLLAKNKKEVVIAQTLSDMDGADNSLCIPRAWVKIETIAHIELDKSSNV